MGWIKLLVTSSRIEADIIKGKLEAEGVSVLLRADDEGGFHPGLTMINGVNIFVDEKDLKDAKEILDL
jgi:hypothetical protein